MPASDGEFGDDLDAAALAYEQVLAANADDGEPAPDFDVHLLGMGGEGHINSLFPHTAAIRETRRLVVGVPDSPKPPPQRITLTLPAIQRSREVWLVVSGAEQGRRGGRGGRRRRSGRCARRRRDRPRRHRLAARRGGGEQASVLTRVLQLSPHQRFPRRRTAGSDRALHVAGDPLVGAADVERRLVGAVQRPDRLHVARPPVASRSPASTGRCPTAGSRSASGVVASGPYSSAIWASASRGVPGPRSVAAKAASRSGGTSADSTPSVCGQVDPRTPSHLGERVLAAVAPERVVVRRNELRGQRVPLPAQRRQPGVADPLDVDVPRGPGGHRDHDGVGVQRSRPRQRGRYAAGRDLDARTGVFSRMRPSELGRHPSAPPWRTPRRRGGSPTARRRSCPLLAHPSTILRAYAKRSSAARSSPARLRWPSLQSRSTSGVAPTLAEPASPAGVEPIASGCDQGSSGSIAASTFRARPPPRRTTRGRHRRTTTASRRRRPFSCRT